MPPKYYIGKYYIGMMSGTSADGIDAALVTFNQIGRPSVHTTCYTAYPKPLQERINLLGQQNNARRNQPEAQALDYALATAYASAAHNLIKVAGISSDEVRAIANHGQTVAHRPCSVPPESIQLGDPQRIADLTQLAVVANFRQADLDAGGQGAPLMPAFHAALLENISHSDKARIVLNLGGIANISVLTDQPEKIIGFDTGPANTLMNQWMKHIKGQNFDQDGSWAASGKADPDLLQKLLSDPYFELPYPKSTGPDYFNLNWLQNISGDHIAHLPARDIQATLLAFTVASIADALEPFCANGAQVFVCGGGAHNSNLIEQLKQRLTRCDVTTSDALGLPPDWVEAVGFAWLGWRHDQGLPGNLPSVTGAKAAVVLGEKYLPTGRDSVVL